MLFPAYLSTRTVHSIRVVDRSTRPLLCFRLRVFLGMRHGILRVVSAHGKWILQYGENFRSSRASSFNSALRLSTSSIMRTFERSIRPTLPLDRDAPSAKRLQRLPTAWAD